MVQYQSWKRWGNDWSLRGKGVDWDSLSDDSQVKIDAHVRVRRRNLLACQKHETWRRQKLMLGQDQDSRVQSGGRWGANWCHVRNRHRMGLKCAKNRTDWSLRDFTTEGAYFDLSSQRERHRWRETGACSSWRSCSCGELSSSLGASRSEKAGDLRGTEIKRRRDEASGGFATLVDPSCSTQANYPRYWKCVEH